MDALVVERAMNIIKRFFDAKIQTANIKKQSVHLSKSIHILSKNTIQYYLKRTLEYLE